MKKILHIAEAFGSGVLNYIKNLSKWQCNDYEVYVAYGIRPETPADFQQQFDARVHFIRVPGFTREIEPAQDIKAFFALKKIVRDIQPDLIHLHSTKAGVLGRWAINSNRYAMYYSPHAYSFLMADCSEGKRRLYRLVERLSDRKNCLTIADIDSEYETSKLVTKHAVCIPNGIDPAEMDALLQKAKEKCTQNTGFTVCMLGKIVPQKDPALFNAIAAALPEINFVWIGDGPLRDVLTSKNITVTGWQDRVSALAKVMAADVFLFPTVYESLSIALMEVMYVGRPCVVSNADGNRDVIRTGANGFVCRTKEEYVQAIRYLRENSAEAEKMGKAARQDILDKYNVHVMEKTYRALMEKSLKANT